MNKYARMMLDKKMYGSRDGGSKYTVYRDGHYPERRERYEERYEPYKEDYSRYDRDYERYGYDRSYRDYGYSDGVRFSREDVEDWKHRMQNEDGTVGEHFKAEQIKRVVEQQGMKIDELGGMETFCLAINMMYSDYCSVARKYGVDRIEFYADLAKAFLKDKDFDGMPEEKLYLYYKFIVDDEK